MTTDEKSNDETVINTKIVFLLESDLPKIVCLGRLSKSTDFSLRVTGPFEEKEAQNLMSILQAQIDVLFGRETP